MRKDKAAARREEDLTHELKRQDKIITNAKPEKPILINEMQSNNGEDIERKNTRAELDVEDLQDGPVIDNDARVIVADDDMVANEEEVVLRDGAGSSSDIRYAFVTSCSCAGPRQVFRFYDKLTRPQGNQGNHCRQA